MPAEALWLLIATPATAAAVLLPAGRRLDRAAGPLGIAQSLLVLGLSTWAWAARPSAATAWLPLPSRDLALTVSAEGPAGALGCVAAAVVLAVTVYAHGFLERGEARARFFGFFALFAAGMQAIVLAGDLLLLLIGWEIVGACSFALIAFWHHEPERVTAARRAFVVTRAADLGLYLAAMAALGAAGTIAIDGLDGAAEPWRAAIAAGLVVAALGKSAQLPFSGWLRGAMEGPTPVSALLHSATMVAAGVVLLIKVAPLLEAEAWAGPVVLAVGVATALAGAGIALVETDVKRALAASTLSQHGYMVAAVGVAGTAAAGTYLVNHAVFKALLFMAAGVLVMQHVKELPSVPARLRRVMPRTALLFLVGVLGLGAVPPAGGFLAKDAVLASVKEASLAGWLLLLLASVLTAAYGARLYLLAFEATRGQRGGRQGGRLRDAGGMVLGPAAVAAAAVLLLALLQVPAVETVWIRALASGELPPLRWGEAAISLGAVVAGLAIACGLFRRDRLLFPPVVGRRAAANWFGLEAGLDGIGELAGRLGRLVDAVDRTRPERTLGLAVLRLAQRAGGRNRAATHGTAALHLPWVARAVWTGGRSVMDRVLAGLPAASATALAGAALWADRAVLDGAVRGLDRILHRAAGTLSRLQSGLLHQYYALTAAGVAVLIVTAGTLFQW